MLDQNTDRMWYVIGADIVGAAIIFLVNSSFPQLFASVGDTFKDKTEQTTNTIDGIMPISRQPNLLDNISVQSGHLDYKTGMYIDSSGTTGNVDRTTDFIDVRGLSFITISLHDVIEEDITWHHGIVWGYDENKIGVNLLAKNINWIKPGSVVVDVSKASYIRANLILQDEYRYKIEKGSVVTSYD